MVVFDLDGTLSNLQHRLHHIENLPNDATKEDKHTAYRAFFAACAGDDVIPQASNIWAGLQETFDIFVITGRSDEVRKETVGWLVKNEFFYDYNSADAHLYMRSEGDYRRDTKVKSELMDQLISDQNGQEPFLIFEDRASVVKMWRDRNFVCYQVAEGDF